MKKLFEETIINGLKLPNRFVRSATWEGLATEEGRATSELAETLSVLAAGGVGLIISGHAYVRKEGHTSPHQQGAHDDLLVPGLKKITHVVHNQGGRIILQLAHAGVFARPQFSGQTPVAVSECTESLKCNARILTIREIKEIVIAFASAARRAVEAGFDGIQIHAAHGYLISQFLSPAFNHRTDEYGGNTGNRAAFLLETIAAVRRETGKDFPLMVKMNSCDCIDGGLVAEEAAQIAGLIEKAGADAIELSGGFPTAGKLSAVRTGINTPEKEAYFRKEAATVRKEISIPLMLVGGIRSYETAKKLLEDGTVDYISMSRPFIREPDIITRWKSGNLYRSGCKSDSLCFRPGFAGKGIRCMTK